MCVGICAVEIISFDVLTENVFFSVVVIPPFSLTHFHQINRRVDCWVDRLKEKHGIEGN